MSPTQRSLRALRQRGYIVAVVERWVPQLKIRQDLFGFCDIICVAPTKTLFVQTTSGSNFSARKYKILSNPNAAKILQNPNCEIVVHGWRMIGARGKRKTYQLREEYVSKTDIKSNTDPEEKAKPEVRVRNHQHPPTQEDPAAPASVLTLGF